MLTRIAVAVDGSEASWAALDFAMHLIAPDGTLLCVDVKDLMSFDLELAAEAYEGGGATDDSIKEWDKQAAHIGKRVKAVTAEHHINAIWHILTVEPGQGGAARAFAQYADKWGAELLVAGQHHGSKFIEDLFGSFPKWLVSHTGVPTLVIPPANDAIEVASSSAANNAP